MNLKGWGEELLSKMTNDEVTLLFIKKRFYMPDGGYRKPKDRIEIWGNGPSLARYGLAHLIGHELSHREHAKRYDGDSGDDSSETFKEIEREFIEKIWEICLEEHENSETCSS
jgi:hypothetical protein